MKKKFSKYLIGCIGNEYLASYSYSTSLKDAYKIYKKKIQGCIDNLDYGPFKVYIRRVDNDQIIKYVDFDENNYVHLKEVKNV